MPSPHAIYLTHLGPDGLYSALLPVELFATPDRWVRGLSGRAQPPAHGMAALFVFPNTEVRSLWMFGVPFDLDAVFVGPDQLVQDVIHLRAQDPTMRRPRSGKPSRYILELARGESERLGIVPGVTRVSFLLHR